MQERIIIGIDPGTNHLGYAIISCTGKNASLVTIGTLKLVHLEDHYQKLGRIYERIASLVKEFNPTEMAIEAPFFGKNVQSMLKLGRAQGVAMAAGIAYQLKIEEYSPKKIKVAVTGSGNASKEQVAALVSKQVKVKLDKQMLDATDALAAALCHFYQNTNTKKQKSYSNWSDFVKKNSSKIK